jgi:hypothetical protein
LETRWAATVRQNLQAQQFGQEERIIGVIRMLDATVLCHPGGVGQHHRILARLQPVHQPVPVTGGFHCHLFQPRFVRCQKLHHRAQLALHLLVGHALAVQVHHANHYIVAVQIHSSYYFLHRSPFGWSLLFCSISNERQLLYREATASLNPHRP